MEKRRKVLGVEYEPTTLNGWRLGTNDRPSHATWIMDEYKHRCIVAHRVMVKWSTIGTKCVAWHPQEVQPADFEQYDPPQMPEDFTVVWDDEERKANI